jgi:hypothetical protein
MNYYHSLSKSLQHFQAFVEALPIWRLRLSGQQLKELLHTRTVLALFFLGQSNFTEFSLPCLFPLLSSPDRDETWFGRGQY